MKLLLTTDTHAGMDMKTDHIHRTRFLPAVVAEKPDVIIHTGDWGITEPKHVERAFRQFREYCGDIPIIGVLGNHDYWDRKHEFRSVQELEEKILEWERQYKIQILDGDSVILGNIKIFGFMGWYASASAMTNDLFYVPCWTDTDAELRQRARNNFNTTINTPRRYKTEICITHFPPYTKDFTYQEFCANQMYFDPLCEKFDYLIVGHSHQQEDFFHKGCRVINPGSDYNKPKFVVLDI